MNTIISTRKEEVIWEENDSTELLKKSENRIASGATVSIACIDSGSVKNEWSVTGKISGIYKIINKVNGKYYVGSAKNIQKGYASRWSKHKCYLRNKCHPNSYLQNAWNKYGESAFEFTILIETIPENLLVEEQRWLDIAEKEQDKTYNLCFIAGRPNKLSEVSKQSQIAKLKLHYSNPTVKAEISRRTKGRKLSEKHKNVLRSLTGIKNHRYGKRISDVEREKKLDKTIYVFRNIHTNEVFTGRRYDFICKYNLNKGHVNSLLHKNFHVKSVKGWVIL